jgi:RND family efflux transporter MFP subunit
MILDQTQLQAELADLMAQEQKNKLNFQRFEYLVRQGAASALQRDEFKANYIESREAVRAKKADLGYKYLQAPIDGIVADVSVKPGDVISAGAPITSLIRNDRLMARIDVPAVYSDRIRPGLRVFLYQPGTDKVIAGALVNSVDPTVAPGTQSLLAKAGFTNPTGVLRNGLRLKTRLELDARLQPSVPFEAVTQSSGQSFVFVLGSLDDLKREPGQLKPDKLKTLPATSSYALQTPVKLGPLQNNRYPVLKGLQAGTRVITTNLINLRTGAPVKVN